MMHEGFLVQDAIMASNYPVAQLSNYIAVLVCPVPPAQVIGRRGYAT